MPVVYNWNTPTVWVRDEMFKFNMKLYAKTCNLNTKINILTLIIFMLCLIEPYKRSTPQFKEKRFKNGNLSLLQTLWFQAKTSRSILRLTDECCVIEWWVNIIKWIGNGWLCHSCNELNILCVKWKRSLMERGIQFILTFYSSRKHLLLSLLLLVNSLTVTYLTFL